MSYTDLTTYASTNKRYDWQDLNSFATNDSYKHLPSGTTWIFFQASAPVGWSRIANGHSNKALRAVDGGGAGGVDGGGAYLVGTLITLGHVHTTPGHTHTLNHGHTLDEVTSTVDLVPGTTKNVSSADSDGSILRDDASAGDTARNSYLNTTKTTNVTSGSTSPSTDSQLADLTIKYFDAQICSKT